MNELKLPIKKDRKQIGTFYLLVTSILNCLLLIAIFPVYVEKSLDQPKIIKVIFCQNTSSW